jgi:DNA-binding response OmpR family regulator
MDSTSSLGELLRIGDLEIRPREGLALAAGRAMSLSVREFTLLAVLASRAGRIVPREELYGAVWGQALRRGDRSVDVYVHKLRVKLGDALAGECTIHTHVGFGYRLDVPPSHPFHTAGTGA